MMKSKESLLCPAAWVVWEYPIQVPELLVRTITSTMAALNISQTTQYSTSTQQHLRDSRNILNEGEMAETER